MYLAPTEDSDSFVNDMHCAESIPHEDEDMLFNMKKEQFLELLACIPALNEKCRQLESTCSTLESNYSVLEN